MSFMQTIVGLCLIALLLSACGDADSEAQESAQPTVTDAAPQGVVEDRASETAQIEPPVAEPEVLVEDPQPAPRAPLPSPAPPTDTGAWDAQIAEAVAQLDFTQARFLAQEAAAASSGAERNAYAQQATTYSAYVREYPQVRRHFQGLEQGVQPRTQAISALLQGTPLIIITQRAVIDPTVDVTGNDPAILPAVLELTRVQQDHAAIPAIMRRYASIDQEHAHHSHIITTLSHLAAHADRSWLVELLQGVSDVTKWQDRDAVDMLLGISDDDAVLDQRLGSGASERLRAFVTRAFSSEDSAARSWAVNHAMWAHISQPGFQCVWWENRDFEGEPDLHTVETRLHWGRAEDFPHARTTDISGRMQGYLVAPQSGRWTFFTNSDDGSRLFIDGEEVVDNWGLHGMQVRSGEIDLVEGQRYAVRIDWFQAGGGAGLIVTVQPPGGEEQPLDASLIQSIPQEHP